VQLCRAGIRSNPPMLTSWSRPLEADGDQTLFTWVLALEPKKAAALPVKVLAPLLKGGFGRIPSGGQSYFAKRT
jgi:hypothetical protein